MFLNSTNLPDVPASSHQLDQNPCPPAALIVAGLMAGTFSMFALVITWACISRSRESNNAMPHSESETGDVREIIILEEPEEQSHHAMTDSERERTSETEAHEENSVELDSLDLASNSLTLV